jgi:hypothetical protein
MSTAGNLAASVKARLKNAADRRGEDFNLLLLRYGIERLLYRLSKSPHTGRFLLKGAMLFVVWDDTTHRPTRDLDLLGFGSVEERELTGLFQEIVRTEVVDDGIAFDPSSVAAEKIREDDAYGGIRVRIAGKMGSVRITVQIDVGAGDRATRSAEPYRILYARHFLERSTPLADEELRSVATEMLIARVLDGDRAGARALTREFPGLAAANTPPRNIYWIGGYHPLIRFAAELRDRPPN